MTYVGTPLREFSLSLYITPVEVLRVGHLAGFRIKWRDSYPRLDEMAPLPSWGGRSGNSVQLLPASSTWPFPNLWFGGHDFARSIRIQQDRFVLAWRAPSAQTAQDFYPGYVVLANEALDAFADFSEVVSQETQHTVTVDHVELQYDNILPRVDAPQFIRAALGAGRTAGPGRADIFTGADYAGLRFHYPATAEESCAVMVGVDTDPEGCSVFLQATTEAVQDHTNTRSVTDTAHEALLRHFRRIVEPHMTPGAVDGASDEDSRHA